LALGIGNQPREQTHRFTTNRQFGQLRVLVAEDNHVNRMVIQGQLNKLGITAVFVENGQEALAEIESVLSTTSSAEDAGPVYDIILMDCEMPVMDGYQAASAIRSYESRIENVQERTHYTRIIALSAHAEKKAVDKALEAGMDDYLTKPTQL
jgi:two-component system, sensor histidine kinase RetS